VQRCVKLCLKVHILWLYMGMQVMGVTYFLDSDYFFILYTKIILISKCLIKFKKKFIHSNGVLAKALDSHNHYNL
jgi:hypothetical protein